MYVHDVNQDGIPEVIVGNGKAVLTGIDRSGLELGTLDARDAPDGEYQFFMCVKPKPERSNSTK